MAGLKRADVLKACENLGVEKVLAPQWATDEDEHVYVRVLPATEQDAVQELGAALKAGTITGGENMAGWCILGVTDAQGVPIFEEGDRAILANGPLTPLTSCFVKLLELNGITGAQDPEKN